MMPEGERKISLKMELKTLIKSLDRAILQGEINA
jgi:hypothetical protein